MLPFLRDMRIIERGPGLCDISDRLQPDHERRPPVDGLLITTGWGTWGFKAIPAGGEGMAELIATGRPSPHRAVQTVAFPRRPPPGGPGFVGDPLMPTLVCPRCGRRSLDEFVFGGERRPVPAAITDPDERDFDEVWVFENPDGPTTERWFHAPVVGAG